MKCSLLLLATLNPSWPSGDSYMFSLSSSQLQQTTLLIDVYDKDISDADEFVGEVTINLASIPGILTGTVSQTYQVKPKVSQRIIVVFCVIFYMELSYTKNCLCMPMKAVLFENR